MKVKVKLRDELIALLDSEGYTISFRHAASNNEVMLYEKKGEIAFLGSMLPLCGSEIEVDALESSTFISEHPFLFKEEWLIKSTNH